MSGDRLKASSFKIWGFSVYTNISQQFAEIQMSVTIHTILDRFRQEATSTRDFGNIGNGLVLHRL